MGKTLSVSGDERREAAGNLTQTSLQGGLLVISVPGLSLSDS